VKLLVNEIFGPTIQGEGRYTGQPCAFVRLAICPLRCNWCDTAYTWAYTEALAARHRDHVKYDFEKEVHEMDVLDVAAQATVAASGARIVVLSGGEPLAQVPPRLQQVLDDDAEPIGQLAYELLVRGISMHIETAGIRRPSMYLHQYVEHYTVSPKLVSSGNSISARRNMEVLTFFADTLKADFKFVVTEPEDFSEIQFLVNACDIPPHRVWVMPEGTKTEAIQRKFLMVAEGAIRRGWNVSGRMHVDVWKDVRGH
jgi:organic radical activating enzyme